MLIESPVDTDVNRFPTFKFIGLPSCIYIGGMINSALGLEINTDLYKLVYILCNSFLIVVPSLLMFISNNVCVLKLERGSS